MCHRLYAVTNLRAVAGLFCATAGLTELHLFSNKRGLEGWFGPLTKGERGPALVSLGVEWR